MKPFLISLCVLTAVLLSIGIVGIQLEWTKIIHPQFWSVTVFYFFLTIATKFISQFSKSLGDENFVLFFMVGTGIRLFGSLVFIAIFLYNGIPDKMQFVLNFFIQYLCFTVFDIYWLITNLRPQSKRQ